MSEKTIIQVQKNVNKVLFVVSVFILAILFVGAIATESDENDEEVQVDEAQFPMMPQMMGMGMGMGMNPMMMNQMNPMMGMNSMMGMGMRGQGNQFQSPQGYAVDYSKIKIDFFYIQIGDQVLNLFHRSSMFQ